MIKGGMQVRLGKLVACITGGPYTQRPGGCWGIKMAAEINEPCRVSVPTRDFDVPDVNVFKLGLVRGIMAMANGEQVHVGCMGGIGRTGLYMAGIAKVMIEYRRLKHRAGRGEDPVLYVRDQYIPHAVETDQQKRYIADLDVSDIVQWWAQTQPLLYGVGKHEFKPVFAARDVVDADAVGRVGVENLDYPRSEWRWECTDGNTVLGYEEWVQHRLESEYFDCDEVHGAQIASGEEVRPVQVGPDAQSIPETALSGAVDDLRLSGNYVFDFFAKRWPRKWQVWVIEKILGMELRGVRYSTKEQFDKFVK